MGRFTCAELVKFKVCVSAGPDAARRRGAHMAALHALVPARALLPLFSLANALDARDSFSAPRVRRTAPPRAPPPVCLNPEPAKPRRPNWSNTPAGQTRADEPRAARRQGADSGAAPFASRALRAARFRFVVSLSRARPSARGAHAPPGQHVRAPPLLPPPLVLSGHAASLTPY